MADNMEVGLATKTIMNAKRCWNLPKDCIHHNDLGAKYTTKETQELLRKLGFQQSLFRTGKPV
jgi:transposase InsO family protein